MHKYQQQSRDQNKDLFKDFFCIRPHRDVYITLNMFGCKTQQRERIYKQLGNGETRERDIDTQIEKGRKGRGKQLAERKAR